VVVPLQVIPEPSRDPRALEVEEGDLDPVADQVVFLAVGRDQALLRGCGGELPDGIVVGGVGEAGIQVFEPFPEDRNQDDLAVGGAAQEAVGTESSLLYA